VDDCGRVLNHYLAEAQVHGGLAQGIGQALYEEVIYDQDGQLLSGTLMDYALPNAQQIPDFVTALVETPSPINPLALLPRRPPSSTPSSTPSPPSASQALICRSSRRKSGHLYRPLATAHSKNPTLPRHRSSALRSGRKAAVGRNSRKESETPRHVILGVSFRLFVRA